MKYEFSDHLSEAEFSAFAESLPHCNFMQKPAWGSVKTTWKSFLCGMKRDGETAAAAHVLLRRLPTGQKLLYAPRGYLVDYADEELLMQFSAEMTAWAKGKGAYMIRIDPEIVLSRTFQKEKQADPDGAAALERLTRLGYRHMGYATDFHSYTQPRFNAEYPLWKNGAPESDEEMRQGFDKKIRKFIGHYTEARGIFFTRGNGEEEIHLFSSISEYTEQRQHILLRDQEYFTRIKEAFGDDCMFFFAKMDLRKFLQFLDEQPQDEQTEKDRAEAERLLQNGETVTLSALQMLRSNDTAYLMYSGFNDQAFPRFRTTNQLRYEAMRYYRDQGCKVFSFMGINGEMNDSLSDFKLKFNPVVVEYAGEFEYPVRRWTYRFMTKFLPFAKRIYINIALRLKGKK